MNRFTLTFAFIKDRPLLTCLNVFIMATAVAMLVVLAKVDHHMQNRLQADAKGIDMVVGAKGSPLQLILSSVYHVDVPTGNIPFPAIHDVKNMPQVKAVVPISLGDSYHGYRIVGTTEKAFDLYQASLKEGDVWAESMQAVLGHEVAKETGLKVGDRFAGSHGLVSAGAMSAHVHEASPYLVVGILEARGTVVDRLILTDLHSVWDVHSHDHDHEKDTAGHDGHNHDDDEVTALLVQFTSPLAAMTLPRHINNNTTLQAAAPAMEMARLMSLVGLGREAFKAFGLILLVVSGVSLFVMLIGALQKYRYDFAVMRTMGASRSWVASLVLGQSVVLGGAGLCMGFAAGYALTYALPYMMRSAYVDGLSLLPISVLEIQTVILVLGVILIASILPVVQAYRSSLQKQLLLEK